MEDYRELWPFFILGQNVPGRSSFCRAGACAISGVPDSGASGREYTLTAYLAPTNNLSPVRGLKYAAGFDGETPVIADALPPDYEGGNHDNEPWCRAVMDNIHTPVTRHTLTQGVHTLRFYRLAAGLVVQKLVLSVSALPYTCLGPEESYSTGRA